MKAGHWEVGIFGADLGENNWGHGDGRLEGFGLVASVIRHLGADIGSLL